MDASEVAHSICDLDGRFLEFDAAFGAILHLSFDEICARNILDVTFADDRQNNGELLYELVEHGRPFTVRKRYVRPDGSLVWVGNHVSRVVGAQGQSRLAACIRPLPVGESEIATMLDKAARRADRIQRQVETLKHGLSTRTARRGSAPDDC